jgi:hypothetical protein
MNLFSQAIKVMRLFGVDDALIGDLLEHDRRSTLWLWRQAAGAIVVAVGADFRAHWVIALRAIVVGMVLWMFALPLAFVLWRHLGFPFISVAVAIGFTHPGVNAVSVALMASGLPSVIGIGWVIARFHRTRTPMPIAAFLVAVWLRWIPGYSRQVSNAITDSRFRPYLATQTLSIVAFSIAVLAGGLWEVHRLHGWRMQARRP